MGDVSHDSFHNEVESFVLWHFTLDIVLIDSVSGVLRVNKAGMIQSFQNLDWIPSFLIFVNAHHLMVVRLSSTSDSLEAVSFSVQDQCLDLCQDLSSPREVVVASLGAWDRATHQDLGDEAFRVSLGVLQSGNSSGRVSSDEELVAFKACLPDINHCFLNLLLHIL